MTAPIIPLARKPAPPACTPMGPPVRCVTPGHDDITEYPARPRPGGQLCERCLPRTESDNRNDEGDDR